jgi:hypothetical protein
LIIIPSFTRAVEEENKRKSPAWIQSFRYEQPVWHAQFGADKHVRVEIFEHTDENVPNIRIA